MSEKFTSTDARNAEIQEHRFITQIYDGMEKATTVGEASDVYWEHLFQLIDGMSKDDRVTLLCSLVDILEHYSDELNEALQ